MKNLSGLLLDACLDLQAIDIEIGVIQKIRSSSRMTSTWGFCKRVNGGYEIVISDVLLQDDVSDEATMNTLVHELLHTCKGCMNHGPKWKALAEKVNSFYPGYNIKRCTSASEKGIAADKIGGASYKYEIVCNHCGASLGKYKKAGKYVNVIKAGSKRYYCTICKSHSLEVKEI